uniref:Vasopressin/oxytocin-related peptide n=1 Tax=Ciona intestinalis TaxID=7719 RepID=B5UA18_CIOIN|nr:uncharacterized protein LOC100178113 precursor [Ciona intestinalis]BAG72193.1 vasopressin/oxytocin-related peptide [Ciona intestinalis]|eukprot:NP_001129313.1 uncharacterized protein LOC100178113 precursor [Ciona intestinalis]
MYRQFSIVLILLANSIILDACFFRDCSNMDWYRKRGQEITDPRKQLFQELPEFLDNRPFQCNKDESNTGNECKFSGQKICCQETDDGQVICAVSATELQHRFLSSGVLQQVQRILHEFVEISSRGAPQKRRYCIKVGVCCSWDRCRPQVSCSYKDQDIPSHKEVFQDQTALVNRISHLLQDMY